MTDLDAVDLLYVVCGVMLAVLGVAEIYLDWRRGR